MSVMPAHSSTARTGPPAMTPVPVAAGLRSTRPAPCSPRISCGMVEPVRGRSTMPRLAASTALRTASETSLAFPVAIPTFPLPSPTATRALNEKRRPPLTTLATRLMAITFSTNSLAWSRSPRSRRGPRSPPRPRPPCPPWPPPRPPRPPPPRRGCSAPGVAGTLAPCAWVRSELFSAAAWSPPGRCSLLSADSGPGTCWSSAI